MTNAKNELLKIIREIGIPIKCAVIEFDEYSVDDEYGVNYCKNKFFLKINYEKSDLNLFLNQINFEYNSEYGSQYLYGVVWLDDGSWLERGEYDSSERWKHKTCPDIPYECK